MEYNAVPVSYSKTDRTKTHEIVPFLWNRSRDSSRYTKTMIFEDCERRKAAWPSLFGPEVGAILSVSRSAKSEVLELQLTASLSIEDNGLNLA